MSKKNGRGHVVGLPVWDRCAVMGVVNVTPDSFSDGGRWFDTTAAVKHGLALVEEGADLVDVGGESTRPGATRVDEAEELKRVIPVVRGLASEGVTISVDTMRASVAEQALAAGAALVNDVSGGLADPDMVPLVAERGCPYVAMHWRGHSTQMQSRAVYDDVVREVCDELADRRDAILAAGVAQERLVLDPGLGFAKHAPHNWALLAHLDALLALGQPVLVGASRKTFLGRIGVADGGEPRPPADRDVATAVTSVVCAGAGVWGVRVHDVAGTRDAFAVLQEVAAHR
jgi:dihydropteroate synthase